MADDVLAVASAHRATSVASIQIVRHDSLWARSARPLPSLDGRGVARDLQHAVSVQAPSCGGQSRSVTQPNPRGKAGDARNGDGHPRALGPPTRPPKPAIELGRKRLRGRANPEIGPIKGRKVRARDRLTVKKPPLTFVQRHSKIMSIGRGRVARHDLGLRHQAIFDSELAPSIQDRCLPSA